MVVATAEGPGMSGGHRVNPKQRRHTIHRNPALCQCVNAVSFGATNGTENDTRQL